MASLAMSVRRRILLAALALAAVATVVVLFLAVGEGGPETELSLVLCGYTNSEAKLAVIKVTNRGNSALTIKPATIIYGDDRIEQLRLQMLGPFGLAARGSTNISLPVFKLSPVDNKIIVFGNSTNKWQLLYYLRYETLSNKMRRKRQKLPWIGPHVDSPAYYEITSDWFEQ